MRDMQLVACSRRNFVRILQRTNHLGRLCLTVLLSKANITFGITRTLLQWLVLLIKVSTYKVVGPGLVGKLAAGPNMVTLVVGLYIAVSLAMLQLPLLASLVHLLGKFFGYIEGSHLVSKYSDKSVGPPKQNQGL